MQLQPLTLVTIVVEEVLKNQIADKILELGATGYTVLQASGYGSRGARRDAVSSNTRFEVVTSRPIAEAILTYVSRHFFTNYACVAWLTEVEVVRGATYLK